VIDGALLLTYSKPDDMVLFGYMPTGASQIIVIGEMTWERWQAVNQEIIQVRDMQRAQNAPTSGADN
jgi:hypothetical protein